MSPRQTPPPHPVQREKLDRGREPTGKASASPEVMKSIIDRAKKIITGQMQRQAMEIHPDVAAFLEKNKQKMASASPEVSQKIIDSLNLQALYPGRRVACFIAPEGFLVVLACGEEEIPALLKGLSPEETAKVVIKYPEPPLICDTSCSTALPSASQA